MVIKRGRDAETGKFLTPAYVEKHPKTTVVERVKPAPTPPRAPAKKR
jgi:hypothetical protein